MIMLYYYRDENHQDKVVSVKKMREMFSQIGTPEDQKREVAIDAGTHIIGSSIFNQNLESVWEPVILFCEEILNLIPVNDTDWKPFLDER